MKKQQNSQLKKTLHIDEYECAFLKPTSTVARCGKSVYICSDFHKKLTRIVCILGDGEITLTDYIHNVLKQHFENFADEINTIHALNQKPIL
ncbi:DUF3408 domain-containing protein [Chryseobacterium indologenes]|uniref:DUF3408 domain-containing protein n=3 Tax=Chryseobacterium TaxID=59732 RepID=A0A3G6RVZ7_CHRLC|nr:MULTISPECIES: DUF3408 domain-containing protein [Bacteroidota]KMQ65177.1 hypothetical protein ACM46_09000 [Chryseobacterium angstadtii]AZA85270.1 DUF3408 domain-containing protein [Chryseobacterium lactis]AZB07217.1 DUF3408 domain-containing protein [Chryseobacterium lactis]MBF6643653.1 DUF3408 domain-containing protein [Chryseobacterium indologenes]PNW14844.1 DUF3408 domain-containing protein [Chryseobacterium lactis]